MEQPGSVSDAVPPIASRLRSSESTAAADAGSWTSPSTPTWSRTAPAQEVKTTSPPPSTMQLNMNIAISPLIWKSCPLYSPKPYP